MSIPEEAIIVSTYFDHIIKIAEAIPLHEDTIKTFKAFQKEASNFEKILYIDILKTVNDIMSEEI